MDYSLPLPPRIHVPEIAIQHSLRSTKQLGKKNRDRHTDKSKDVASPLKRTEIRMYYISSLKRFLRLTYNIYHLRLFPTDRLKKSGYY
jgi:hypothetical protein